MKETQTNILKTKAFIFLLQEFKTWLMTLGYSQSSVYNMPILAKEYLLYLESESKLTIDDINKSSLEHYYRNHLQTREHKRSPGKGISNSHLNKHQQALNLLCSYLRKNGRLLILAPNIRNEVYELNDINPISTDDIQHLFDLTEDHKDTKLDYHLELRDKAMLSLFYSCGLRRNEAQSLNLYDVNLTKQFIHVRHAKGNKERYVPFTKETKLHFQNYIYDSRPKLIKGKHDAFLTGERGLRFQGQSMAKRLEVIQSRSYKTEFKERNIHPHLLRHSIATHLLQKGMAIEDISRFLGHSSLESTQRYTHIINPKPNTS